MFQKDACHYCIYPRDKAEKLFSNWVNTNGPNKTVLHFLDGMLAIDLNEVIAMQTVDYVEGEGFFGEDSEENPFQDSLD